MKKDKTNTVEEIYNELQTYYRDYLEEIGKCLSLMSRQDVEYNQEFVRLHRQKLETRNLLNVLNMMYVDYANMLLWFDYAVNKYGLDDKYRLFSIVADKYDIELTNSQNTLTSRVGAYIDSLMKNTSIMSGLPYQQIESDMAHQYDKIRMFMSE